MATCELVKLDATSDNGTIGSAPGGAGNTYRELTATPSTDTTGRSWAMTHLTDIHSRARRIYPEKDEHWCAMASQALSGWIQWVHSSHLDVAHRGLRAA